MQEGGNGRRRQHVIHDFDGIQVIAGRYGPYIKQDGSNYRIPKDVDAASLDKAACEKIISEKGERFIDIAWPIFSGKGGTLRLGVSEKTYRQQVFNLWMQMNLITLGILIICLFVVHFLISRSPDVSEDQIVNIVAKFEF